MGGEAPGVRCSLSLLHSHLLWASTDVALLRNRGDRSSLAAFTGRPQELSPKARYHLFMAKLFPNTYACVLSPT